MPELTPELAALLEKLPGDDYDATREVLDEILAGGVDAIRRLVAAVVDEFGHPPGTPAQYALHGLAHYAARPGAAEPRALVAETLAAELAADHASGLKAFLCRQLQLCGRSQEVRMGLAAASRRGRQLGLGRAEPCIRPVRAGDQGDPTDSAPAHTV